jgi:methionine-gamma-lyase
MAKHGENALYLAHQFESVGLPVYYPGLEGHPQHELATSLMNPGYGYGETMAVDMGDMETAGRLLMQLQDAGVGYLAVSLGYFKTLFSAPGQSTSSEIPTDEQLTMGLCEGLIRISVGLDNDIRNTLGSYLHEPGGRRRQRS